MHVFAAIQNVLRSELGFPTGNLFEGISLEAANRLWLERSFGKKFQPEDTSSADDACLSLFKESNERCKSFTLLPKNDFQRQVIGEVKSLFYDLYAGGPDLYIDLDAIASRFMVGPGASQGSLSFNFYSKLFDSPLTSTSDTLFRLYNRALDFDPNWKAGEVFRFSKFGLTKVVGNRLSYAPKTSIISRSICTEPSLNMLFQKGIGACIEDGLRRVFKIDLSKQPYLNRKLACQGSKDGSFGTIDLSSASDSMSLRIMKELCHPDFFRWLAVSRSGFVTYPSGESEELHMVSSMGNGFTFPLQTYLFASIVVATYRTLAMKPRFRQGQPINFGVFGDDIIVCREAYEDVVASLKLFGFSVNDDKSFNVGSFRESCGGDFYRGFDIRGVYIKSLKHDADVYSAINRLIRWSARTGILIPQTIKALLDLIGASKPLLIPPSDGDSEGLKVPYPPSCLDKRDRNTGALFYYALVKKSRSFRLPDNSEKQLYYPRKGKRRDKILFNPSGLLVTVVAGFLRSGRVTVRDLDRETFQVKRRMTNSWSELLAPVDADLLLSSGRLSDQTGFASADPSIVTRRRLSGFLSCRGYEWAIVAEGYLS